MIRAYKDRTVQRGQRVRVYRNLHNGLYSILDVGTGHVLAHGHTFALRNAYFHVNQAGRRRVVANKRKEVHAWVEGDFEPIPACAGVTLTTVTYNPYRSDYFTTTTRTVHFSPYVLIDGTTSVQALLTHV